MSYMTKRKFLGAINNGEFYIMYQPIFNGYTQSFDSAEVLLRWKNKAGVDISPSDFIPLAENSGCIIPLTLHLFHLIRSDIIKWNNKNEINIGLNISSIHTQSQCFINDIIFLTKNIPSKIKFTIEFTERNDFYNDKKFIALFNRLKVMGLALSLDDFGSGYSNFDMLAKYHFDYVKISGHLLDSVHINDRTLAIINHSLSLIAELGAIPVVEHIEHKSQYDLLKRNSCLYQGFLFSKPLLAHEFLSFMNIDIN